MPRLKVAHIRAKGADLIIVPLDISFGDRPSDEQAQTINELRRTSQKAGLSGDVVPVWDSGAGCMSFIAPESHHPFFSTLSLQQVYQNLNRVLTW